MYVCLNCLALASQELNPDRGVAVNYGTIRTFSFIQVYVFQPPTGRMEALFASRSSWTFRDGSRDLQPKDLTRPGRSSMIQLFVAVHPCLTDAVYFSCPIRNSHDVRMAAAVKHEEIIKPHAKSALSRGFADCENLPGEQYKLYAVVNHSGSLSYGHYTAYCKVGEGSDKKWYFFNDAACLKLGHRDCLQS